MGFFSNIFSAGIKTALSPVAFIKDAVNVATGEEPDETKKLIQSSANDVTKAVDDLVDGKL